MFKTLFWQRPGGGSPCSQWGSAQQEAMRGEQEPQKRCLQCRIMWETNSTDPSSSKGQIPSSSHPCESLPPSGKGLEMYWARAAPQT